MAAMQAMLNSMTPEQRAQLQQLSDKMMEDMDLRWQVDQLGQNLRRCSRRWAGTAATSSRARPVGFGEAMQMMQELGDLDQLENLLRDDEPGALAEVDIDRVRELLGDDTARVARTPGRAGEDARRSRADRTERRPARADAAGHAQDRPERPARDLQEARPRTRVGQHEVESIGVGHERKFDTKPYEFGDPFNLNIERTMRNAMCARGRRHAGASSTPDDFEIERTEHVRGHRRC